MLQELHIENFTIIEKLNLSFNHGMTVVTGETGAGKSITIDALELALGARADTQVIRPGSERCEIIAQFDIQKIIAAQQWLQEQELSNSDNDCVLRRIVANDGRSKSFINDKPVSLQSLRALGELLVNIHGQHEHQTLLQRDAQRELLDAFADNQILLKQIKAVYIHWQSLNEKLIAKQKVQSERDSRLEFLRFQTQEFQQVALGENELEALDKEQKLLAHADQYISNYQQAVQLLDQNDSNILKQLHQAQLLTADNDGVSQLLESASIALREAVSELNNKLEKIEINPERLQWVEQRLTKIFELARKHRIKPEALFTLSQQLMDELSNLENNDASLASLEAELKTLTAQYAKLADQLTQQRELAAKKMAKKITDSMQTLGMPGGKFSITLDALSKEELHPYGQEKIEFLVSANPGQPLQPLNKTASGGELSRISLAIQVNAAQKHSSPTLIFDEVDVGIGGATAAIVGQLLKQLSQQAQIICVTHLPQVASVGTQHFQVQKTTDKKTTHTHMTKLSQEDRIKEIARMLGGLKITEQTLAHAKEMIEG